MTKANSSIKVTPGTGPDTATHSAGGKEHQLMMPADSRGYILGSADTFVVDTNFSANVAAARTTHLDLFNAAGSGVVLEILGIYIVPSQTAVTGVGLTWELIRTTAVGTGGTAVVPRPLDSTNAALPAAITARSKATGGATSDYVWTYMATSSEETTPYAGMASVLNHLDFSATPDAQKLTLNPGEGLKVDQTLNSAVGTTNLRVVFAVK